MTDTALLLGDGEATEAWVRQRVQLEHADLRARPAFSVRQGGGVHR